MSRNRGIVCTTPGEAISLEDPPKGHAEFDKGAAVKFVLDPHGLLATPA